MKSLVIALVLLSTVQVFAAPKLKPCSELLSSDVQVCIDISPKTSVDTCEHTVSSGSLWMDEFQLSSAEELYSTNAEACEAITSEVPFTDEGLKIEYCCGG